MKGDKNFPDQERGEHFFLAKWKPGGNCGKVKIMDGRDEKARS